MLYFIVIIIVIIIFFMHPYVCSLGAVLILFPTPLCLIIQFIHIIIHYHSLANFPLSLSLHHFYPVTHNFPPANPRLSLYIPTPFLQLINQHIPFPLINLPLI